MFNFKKKLLSKFGNKRTEFRGRKYASRLEAAYAAKLQAMKDSGRLLFWLEQVPIQVSDGTTYRLDFLEFWEEKGCDCSIVFTEVKGNMTPLAKLKIELAEKALGVQINIVKKV